MTMRLDVWKLMRGIFSRRESHATCLTLAIDPKNQNLVVPDDSLVDELFLTLYNPTLFASDGRERLRAEATLEYRAASSVHSSSTRNNDQRFRFTVPLNPLAATELAWYLEDYPRWPIGEFQRRAQIVATILPRWGQALYRAALGSESARPAREAWQRAVGKRRFTVRVDTTPASVADGQRQTAFGSKSGNPIIANTLVALPWELLHDGDDYLFHGPQPVALAKLARGYGANREERVPAAVEPPLRVLLVCPRPVGDDIPYLDHRQMAQPLTQALTALGGLAQLTILTPPTLGELEKNLAKARRRRTPYTVIHFDSYGIHDRHGAICFEQPQGLERLEGRPGVFVEADDLAAVLREYHVSMVFLTGSADLAATALALRLLRVGVNAVLTMTHRVPNATSTQFLEIFYRALLQGASVSMATAQARQALCKNEALITGAWFVPVLYQDAQDFQPLRRVATTRLADLHTEQCNSSCAGLRSAPVHGFYGRSREMLALERRLLSASYAVITGPDGIGKTTLALETARWLVASGRFERAAVVSLKEHPHPRAVLDTLGRQLVRDWDDSSVMTDPQAQQQIERVLTQQPTLIVWDNVSPHLSPQYRDYPDGACMGASSNLQTILDLCRALQRAALTTRLLFTSHEALPPPYTGHTHALGLLAEDDAVALVAGVLRANDLPPLATDSGRTHTELANLVQAAGRYPRALALMVPAVARYGVRATTNKLRAILADIDSSIPVGVTEKEGITLRHLYAAVVLSLRALPVESQEQVRILAHCQRVASSEVIAAMLDLTLEAASTFGAQLIAVGLVRDLGDGCFGLEPALPPYLTATTNTHRWATDHERWLKAMVHRLNSLYKAWFRDADLGLRLTRRELPNLLILLDWTATHRSAEEALGLIWRLETLLAPLRLPRLLDRVTALRERLAPRLVGWGRAAFAAEAAAVERLLESGWLPEALQQAQALVGRATNAGDKAYPGATHDLGMAHRLLSRALDASGTPAPALAHLELARRRFAMLAAEGSELAARMASVCCTERGDCLRALGQLDAAATAYQEALAADEARHAVRDAALNRLQLADILRLQGIHAQALILYTRAREAFLEAREFSMVAVAWHQIGLIHQELKDWSAAETAYKEVLTIWIRRGDLNGEALTLTELGDLYRSWDGALERRQEQAATCYRQAAERYATLANTFHEGQARRRLAETLLELGDSAAVRPELERAIVCQATHGHTVEPWQTWALLMEIERQQDHQEAANRAREEAAMTYLAYRRDGGDAIFPGGRLCEQVANIMAHGKKALVLLERLKAATLESNSRHELHTLLSRLQEIVAGSRDPILADNATMHYSDIAELRLLLERL